MHDSSIPHKRCAMCQLSLPITVFYPAKRYKYGVGSYCKRCTATYKGRIWHPECLIPDGYRQCGECKELKEVNESNFRHNKNCKGGWSNKCKQCSDKYDSNWLEDNRDLNKERSKARYYAKPEARKKYKEEHKEQIAATKRRIRKEKPEQTRKHKRDSSRRFRVNHPELARLRSRISTMRRRVKVGNFERSDLMAMYEEQENRCAYCGITIFWNIPNDIHVDHVIPVTKSGTNDLDNLALTCADCNLSKHDLSLEEWMTTRNW